jgi:hypothetical protein
MTSTSELKKKGYEKLRVFVMKFKTTVLELVIKITQVMKLFYFYIYVFVMYLCKRGCKHCYTYDMIFIP